jgi:hypothetical protein
MKLSTEVRAAIDRVQDRRLFVQVRPGFFKMPFFDELEGYLGRELTDLEYKILLDTMEVERV